MMLQRVLVHAAASVLVTAGIAEAQKPPKCSDVPIQVSIVPTSAGVLADDGSGPYEAGSAGVYNTVIHVCGSNPSYDATMGLITSRRSLRFRFPAPNSDSVEPGPAPGWVASDFLAKPFMNVRKILWGRLHGVTTPNTFTTRMGFISINGPGDKADYMLQFAPTYTDSGSPGNPDANHPSETTAATVEDIPGTCRSAPGGTLDKWVVTVDAPATGTLLRSPNSGSNVQSGQYTMPFQLLITAKVCLPF